MAEPAIIKKLRRIILETAAKAREGHIPSSLSVLDIVWCLYDGGMAEYDAFILSKGHAALALYAVLAEREIINRHLLDGFCNPGSPLHGHPEIGTPGVMCSTGSLGHGLPMAVGMAYGRRLAGEPGRVWCLIGDGEAQEGSIFEALRIADDLNLDNLTVIVELNEPEREKHARRLAAFVDHVWDIRDGHDHAALRQAFAAPFRLVFVKTVKGHGVAEMEADPRAWHHRTFGLAEMLEAAE